jgi:hypothetical protein
MTDYPHKLSEAMKEMAELLFLDPNKTPSSEAVHVTLLFANVAWNECVGLDDAREGSHNVWETIEADNPELWNELKSDDIDAMIDELVEYKKAHYADDRRRILACGCTPHGTIRVEWLPAVAPGADVKLDMQVYGLVRTGSRKEAIRFLQEACGMSPTESAKKLEEGTVREDGPPGRTYPGRQLGCTTRTSWFIPSHPPQEKSINGPSPTIFHLTR